MRWHVKSARSVWKIDYLLSVPRAALFFAEFRKHIIARKRWESVLRDTSFAWQQYFGSMDICEIRLNWMLTTNTSTTSYCISKHSSGCKTLYVLHWRKLRYTLRMCWSFKLAVVDVHATESLWSTNTSTVTSFFCRCVVWVGSDVIASIMV